MAGQLSLQEKIKIQRPRKYRVLIHNDDLTPMDFVVWLLMKVFHYDEPSAVELMLTVHHGAGAVVGLYSRDVAMTKVREATGLARDEGHPLKLTAEPE